MGDGRRKRGSAKHAGVVLKHREWSTGSAWRAQYYDPDKPGLVWETLPRELTTAEMRSAWAERKARELEERVRALARGESRITATTLVEAREDYFRGQAARLSARTLALYRDAIGLFCSWCSSQGVTRVADLLPSNLAAFRETLATRPRQVVARGGTRGARATAGTVAKPTTINKQLRAVATFLRRIHELGLTPRLTSDAIRGGLKPLRQPRPRPTCLRPGELRQLLGAALRHDAETFSVTRAEHAGERQRGTTARYPSIAPFVATVLLTGMRVGEAAALRTDAVYLDSSAGTGGAGEIVLRSHETKTDIERAVDLVVSPALKQLLTALKLRATGPYLFGGEAPLRPDAVEAARRRLTGERGKPRDTGEGEDSGSYGAPRFTWQMLRQTCGSYLTNAPGIFGAASAFRSAKQLGHSITVAEKHYLGLVHVPPEARTLEAAMQVEGELERLFASLGCEGGRDSPRTQITA